MAAALPSTPEPLVGAVARAGQVAAEDPEDAVGREVQVVRADAAVPAVAAALAVVPVSGP